MTKLLLISFSCCSGLAMAQIGNDSLKENYLSDNLPEIKFGIKNKISENDSLLKKTTKPKLFSKKSNKQNDSISNGNDSLKESSAKKRFSKKVGSSSKGLKNKIGKEKTKNELLLKNKKQGVLAQGDSLKERLDTNTHHLKQGIEKRTQKDSLSSPNDTASTKDELKVKMESSKQNISDKKDSLQNTLKNKVPSKDSIKSALAEKVPFKKDSFNKDSLQNAAKDKISDKKDDLTNKAKSEVQGRKQQLKTKVKSVFNDTAGLKKRLLSFDMGGTISGGYEYGVLPCVVGNNFPTGGIKMEGAVSFSLATLPLNLTFHYTTIKNVVGLNNYFRLSFNSARYKEQLVQKLNFKNKLSLDQLGKLQIKQQQLLQKLEYLKFLQQNPNYKVPGVDTSGVKQKGIDSVRSAMSDEQWSQRKDSILNLYKDNKEKYDSVSKVLQRAQALRKDPSSFNKDDYKMISDKTGGDRWKAARDSASYYLQKKDSVMNEVSVWKARYDSINNVITELKLKIAQIRALMEDPGSVANPYLSKGEQFLSHIKKFEIGLCNPSYSTFLISNIPVQGVNVEYIKNNNFVGLTYGTTVNNLLTNPHTLEGMLKGVRNLYNYFDFGNLSSGRKVLSIKGGMGTPETTHLLVGFELGKGRTDYLTVTPDASSGSFSKESNLVLEVDARYKFSEQLSVDVILGKSSVKDGDLNFSQIKSTLNEVLSPHRSYALLTRVNTGIRKTSTNLTFSVRWIDPYFKSFGVGFLRSDNLRYEVKAVQPLTKKIRYTVTYRRDTDNLLHLYDYKNTLQSVNNAVNMKVSRQINIRLNYAPLFRELRSSETVIRDVNHIFGAILSFTPRPKNKINSQFNFLYCKNLITTDSANVNFENFTYTHQVVFPSRIKTGLSVSWFKNTLTDTLNNDTYMAVLDIGYSTRNKSSFSIGGKMAYKKGIEVQYGFVAKVALKIYKGLFWETEAERIIIGDYYNSFNIDQIKRFPYYGNTKLILNF